MSQKLEVPRCPQCRRHATHVVVNDAERAVAFVRCDPCGLAARRGAVLDAQGRAWQWELASLWAFRDQANRVFHALWRARQETGATREMARQSTNALVATWFGREEIGPWTQWSARDCQAMLTHASPLLQAYADQLVTGADRLALHVAAAKRSAFPRMTLAWLLARDRLRAAVQRFIERFRVRTGWV
jgi:hypothetical protein